MAPIAASVQIVMVLAFVLGCVNQLAQTGKLFGQFAAPAKLLPYLVTFGSFLGGAVAFLQGQNPLVFNEPTILSAIIAGGTTLLAGTSPGIVVHHFGGQVSMLRPKAVAPPAPVEKKAA